MFEKFVIKNFKSITETAILMNYNEGKAPNNYAEMSFVPFLETQDNAKFAPILSIFGPNASGKTNLTRAINTFLQVFAKGIDKRYFPNRLNNQYDYTSFDFVFYEKNIKYRYCLHYNQDKILEEQLFDATGVLFSINNEKQMPEYNFDRISAPGYGKAEFERVIAIECNQNGNQIKTFLSKVVEKYPGLNNYLNAAAIFINKKVIILNGDIMRGLMLLEENGIKHQKVFEDISKIVRDLDIDINRMQLFREEMDLPLDLKEISIDRSRPMIGQIIKTNSSFKKIENYITSFHKDINGNEVEFDFLKDESSGTITLFGLIAYVLATLQRGGVLIADELDKSLHPLLVQQIIRMFKDKRYNKTNAQLIFTAHNAVILDDELFRKSEIAFVNKSMKKGTTLRYLYEFDGVRNANDFLKQYLEGKFTGLPSPYI